MKARFKIKLNVKRSDFCCEVLIPKVATTRAAQQNAITFVLCETVGTYAMFPTSLKRSTEHFCAEIASKKSYCVKLLEIKRHKQFLFFSLLYNFYAFLTNKFHGNNLID